MELASSIDDEYEDAWVHPSSGYNYTRRPDSSIPFADADTDSWSTLYTAPESFAESYHNSRLSSKGRRRIHLTSTDTLAHTASVASLPTDSIILEPTNSSPNLQRGGNDDEVRVPVNGDIVVADDTDTECLDSFLNYTKPETSKQDGNTSNTTTNKRGILSCCKTQRKVQSEEIKRLKGQARKQLCLQTFIIFVYVLLAILAVVVTYSLILDLIFSMNNPVRSIQYNTVNEYEAPGIAIYPGGADLLACGHYFNNIVTSKVKLSMLDLVNRNCTYINMTYDDPFIDSTKRTALLFRGPTKPNDGKEAVFIHFQLIDPERDFFTVSYYLFSDWDDFNRSSPPEQLRRTLRFHQFKPTYALSAGLRMWIKLIMRRTHRMENAKITDFKIEYSVVQLFDKRPESERNSKHLFFIFFEWKDDIIEESYLLTTTTPWSIGAALCGVFLTLHKGYQLAQDSYRRMQKSKRKQATFRETLKIVENRQPRSSAIRGSRNNGSRRTTPLKCVDADSIIRRRDSL